MSLHDGLKSLLAEWVQAWPIELAATVIAEQSNSPFMHELVDITLSDYYGEVTGDPANAERAKDVLRQMPVTCLMLRRAVVSLARERLVQCPHERADYSIEHDNFYCVVCRHGMGQEFYNRNIALARSMPRVPKEYENGK